jgi:hypothetical protein
LSVPSVASVLSRVVSANPVHISRTPQWDRPPATGHDKCAHARANDVIAELDSIRSHDDAPRFSAASRSRVRIQQGVTRAAARRCAAERYGRASQRLARVTKRWIPRDRSSCASGRPTVFERYDSYDRCDQPEQRLSPIRIPTRVGASAASSARMLVSRRCRWRQSIRPRSASVRFAEMYLQPAQGLSLCWDLPRRGVDER